MCMMGYMLHALVDRVKSTAFLRGRGVMVAARDLKSRDLESCGFDSHRPHCVCSSMVEQWFVVPHMWVQFPPGTAGVAELAYAHG